MAKKKTVAKPAPKKKQINEQLYKRIFIYTLIVYFPLLLFFNLMRLWGYGFSIVDLGIFNQLSYNFVHGDLFQTSVKYPFHENSSWLGFHFIVLPIVIAAPFYYVFPAPETLCVLHVAIVSLSSIIIYKICERLNTGKQWSCFWALVYLFNPLTIYHALFSFQESTISVPLMALCVYFMIARNFRGLVISCLLLLLTKEQYGLTVATFGMLWALYHRSYKQGAVLFVAGIAAFLLVIFVIIPHFSPFHAHFMLSEKSGDNTQRYQWLLQSPDLVLSALPEKLFNSNNGKYILSLLLPFIFLPLGAIMLLMPLAPDILITLLSDFTPQKKWIYYYSAPLVPVLITAAAITFKKSKSKKTLAWLIVIVTIIGITPIFNKLIIRMGLFSNPNMEWNYGMQYQKAISVVPEDAFLIVDDFTAVPASGRRRIAGMEPDLYEKADYAMIRLSPYRYGPFLENMNSIVLTITEDMVVSPNWGLVYWQYPFAVFKKGSAGTVDEKEMREILERYKSMAVQERE